MTPFVDELVGTMILILFGSGVVVGSLLKFSKGNLASGSSLRLRGAWR